MAFKNSPTSGARFDADLPSGTHPLQLYSLGTPNGQKITIMLEELGVPYDAFRINILNGENFSSGFIKLSPNEKIPLLLDRSTASAPHSVFESGAILMYLADTYDKTGTLYPKDPLQRSVVTQWLMWQMGTAPYLGQFGHFFKYAKVRVQYALDRYTMETKRILDVLDKQLERTGAWVAGDVYTIADVAVYPWICCLDGFYKAGEVLGMEQYAHVEKWRRKMRERNAVVVGMGLLGSGGEQHLVRDGRK